MTQPSSPLPTSYPLPRAFPPGIRWSAATAAFQIEGARNEDGRGRSIWDDFVDTPGLVKDAGTAEPGPDSYHRYLEDVALAQGLGLDRYRFGISWVRVLPEGTGTPNQAGLDYYSRLIDALLQAGVTPFPTRTTGTYRYHSKQLAGGSTATLRIAFATTPRSSPRTSGTEYTTGTRSTSQQ